MTGAGALRVLVIDDDEVDRLLFRRLLAQGSRVLHALDEAETAEAGLARLADHPVDCLLLDVNLPDADAEEVIEALQGREALPPLVLVSGGEPPPERAAKLRQAGPLLSKNGLDAERLGAAIGEALGRVRR